MAQRRIIEVDVEVNGVMRHITVARLTLGDLEDLETGKMSNILTVMAKALGMSRDEIRGIYPEDLNAIMEAIKQANNVPLGSA